MIEKSHVPCIYVLAGTNGAGKSSIGGAMIRESGASYFNPDEAAAKFLSVNPDMAQAQANGAAWRQGKRLLERAIAGRLDFAFETTLGGRTMAELLEKALTEKMEVRMWYVGLATLELHIARVRSRVAAGGHDIPTNKIRERFKNSRLNLLKLMPKLTELRVYDNSTEGDPRDGIAPQPKLLVHMDRGQIVESCDLAATPDWAKPILAMAMKLSVAS